MLSARYFFTLEQVAEMRGFTPKTVLNAIHNGELGAYRYSARIVVIERPDLESWRMPGAKPPEMVAITMPKRERYAPKDVAAEFATSTKSVRLAMWRGQLAFRHVNASVTEISPSAVAEWRAACRQRAKVPVERLASARGKTFRKGKRSALKLRAARTHVAA